jgi:hypothetical protein
MTRSVACLGAMALLLAGACAANAPGTDETTPGNTPPQNIGTAVQSLIVSGRILAAEAVLDPAFRMMTTPAVQIESSGRHQLMGLDVGGEQLFSIRFDGTDVADLAHDEQHFTLTVPLTSELEARLHTLELRAANGHRAVRRASMTEQQLVDLVAHEDVVSALRAADGAIVLRWDAARFPLVVVRDPGTGQVLAFARGGEITVRTAVSALELIFSEGVRSARRTVDLPG